MNIKQQILDTLKVKAQIDVEFEVKRRVAFIKNILAQTNMKSLVLGISGGIDSTVTGKLAMLAVKDTNYEFIAIRLPYGVQQDEVDATMACDFINPSKKLTIDIKPGVDAIHASCMHTQINGTHSNEQLDFIKGNLKARTRMAVQYQIAALNSGLVLGTDHSAENLTGFFTKYGDGACDLAPLFGLNKRQVRAIGHFLGAPDKLVTKPATADLEELKPLYLDEEALGISYDAIDDFLEGKEIDSALDAKLVEIYLRTEHKRKQIPTVYDVKFDIEN